MKNSHHTLALLGLCVALCAFSTISDGNKKFYNAYISGIQSFWHDGIRVMKETDLSDNETKFQLAVGQYGLLNATMKDKDEKTFDEFADNTIETFEELIDDDYKVAECKAVLSSIYGLKMAYSPWKGIYLGSKSNRLMEEAKKNGEDSPLVWKLYGGSKLFTPKTWGGNPEKAVAALEEAVRLFESKGQIENNWLYLDTMALLGIAYAKTKDQERARATFNKALEIEPDFGWVKYSLLPQVNQ
ncbi:MAG: tetratricopeptide repeat protein [Bacteroidota bacterium]